MTEWMRVLWVCVCECVYTNVLYVCVWFVVLWFSFCLSDASPASADKCICSRILKWKYHKDKTVSHNLIWPHCFKWQNHNKKWQLCHCLTICVLLLDYLCNSGNRKKLYWTRWSQYILCRDSLRGSAAWLTMWVLILTCLCRKARL